MHAIAGWLLIALVQPPADEAKPEADGWKPEAGWKSLGDQLWFDPAKKELVLRARVCLREGPLEHLLCKGRTKEHEAILATDAPPRSIHAGLLLTGAEVGHPVRFRPDYAPPAGTPIAIELEWTHEGKRRTIDARQWIVDLKKKPLPNDWVFAGSTLYTDPETKRTYYGADDGDLVTVCNFETSLLDLPIASSASDSERNFQADPEKVPPLGTPVTVRLRPRPPAEAQPAPAEAGKAEVSKPAPDVR